MLTFSRLLFAVACGLAPGYASAATFDLATGQNSVGTISDIGGTPQVTMSHLNVPQVKTAQANTQVYTSQLNTPGLGVNNKTGNTTGPDTTVGGAASPIIPDALQNNEQIQPGTLTFGKGGSESPSTNRPQLPADTELNTKFH